MNEDFRCLLLGIEELRASETESPMHVSTLSCNDGLV